MMWIREALRSAAVFDPKVRVFRKAPLFNGSKCLGLSIWLGVHVARHVTPSGYAWRRVAKRSGALHRVALSGNARHVVLRGM